MLVVSFAVMCFRQNIAHFCTDNCQLFGMLHSLLREALESDLVMLEGQRAVVRRVKSILDRPISGGLRAVYKEIETRCLTTAGNATQYSIYLRADFMVAHFDILVFYTQRCGIVNRTH